MINELSEDQIALQVIVANEWIDLAHSGKFDEFAAKEAVKTVYEISDIAPPKEIIIAESAMDADTVATILKVKKVSVWASIFDSVVANIDSSIWDVKASVRDNVRARVDSSIWDSVKASVWNNVAGSVGDVVRPGLGDTVWARCEYFNYSDFGWTAFYSYFRQIGILKHEKFEKWEAALKSNIFEIYTYENVCIVVKPPVSIRKNDTGLLHNPSGPAIVFPDGYCQ